LELILDPLYYFSVRNIQFQFSILVEIEIISERLTNHNSLRSSCVNAFALRPAC